MGFVVQLKTQVSQLTDSYCGLVIEDASPLCSVMINFQQVEYETSIF